MRNAVKICKEYKELNTFGTYIAGITKTNDEGLDVQEIVKNYMDFSGDIIESGKLRLVQEPDNPYDKHAIKIFHDDIGHIGYIPAKHAVKVNKIISAHPPIRAT